MGKRSPGCLQSNEQNKKIKEKGGSWGKGERIYSLKESFSPISPYSPFLLNGFMDKDEFEKAKTVAYRFLSYRPRSKKEVEKKLKEKKFAEETIKYVINFLEESNYINDREFTLNWVRYRMENMPRGRTLLEYELRGKGIASDLIKESLDKIYKDEFDEYEIAVKMAEKKMVSLSRQKMKSHVIKRTIFNYLQRKGFSYDMIERAISTMVQSEPADSI